MRAKKRRPAQQQNVQVKNKRARAQKPGKDVYEAEDSDPDERKNAYRYDVSATT